MSIRRFTALILQLALLALPLSGIRAQDAHCTDADHAPATTTMDIQCHAMPSCVPVVMRAEPALRVTARMPIQVPPRPAVCEYGWVARAPEPPPPRA